MSDSHSLRRRLFSRGAFLVAPLLFFVACHLDVEIGSEQPCATDADCQSGQVCTNGACVDPACQPQAEVCDGLDNDCNGVADDGCNQPQVCMTDADCQPGQACDLMTSTCFDLNCQPQPEVCDAVDNNCNGVVDENCNPPNCQPQPEVCDGLDNDCNGLVDENCGPQPCMTDADCPMCLLCDPMTWTCFYPDCQPQPEVCDGLDNDCNGLVDENCNPQPCMVDAECPMGQFCDPMTWTCFDPNCQPQPEVCDGIDNDCNGLVDENCNPQP
ncbi:MAG TPA: MopE-related protein [Bacilli bacterium]|nr:MopE-related protein [Bacilli bacterium]